MTNGQQVWIDDVSRSARPRTLPSRVSMNSQPSRATKTAVTAAEPQTLRISGRAEVRRAAKAGHTAVVTAPSTGPGEVPRGRAAGRFRGRGDADAGQARHDLQGAGGRPGTGQARGGDEVQPATADRSRLRKIRSGISACSLRDSMMMNAASSTTAAHQVPDRLLRLSGHPDRRQLPGPVQPGQPARVPLVFSELTPPCGTRRISARQRRLKARRPVVGWGHNQQREEGRHVVWRRMSAFRGCQLHAGTSAACQTGHRACPACQVSSSANAVTCGNSDEFG
jgi:hypothetical protein